MPTGRHWPTKGRKNDGWVQRSLISTIGSAIRWRSGAGGGPPIDLLNYLFSEDPVTAVLAQTATQGKQLADGSPAPTDCARSCNSNIARAFKGPFADPLVRIIIRTKMDRHLRRKGYCWSLMRTDIRYDLPENGERTRRMIRHRTAYTRNH